jgi:hypothetical protein
MIKKKYRYVQEYCGNPLKFWHLFLFVVFPLQTALQNDKSNSVTLLFPCSPELIRSRSNQNIRSANQSICCTYELINYMDTKD